MSALGTGRLYLSRNISGTYSRQRLSQPQGHSSAGKIMLIKILMTQSGIGPATFRLVAQCLNLQRHGVPPN